MAEIKDKRIGIRITESLKEKIEEEAKRQNRSMSNLVESILKERFEKEK